MRELILGGARSGKSTLAEERARDSGLAVTYIATAEAGDEEMAARIAAHRARRPSSWRTIEVPSELPATLADVAAPGQLVIVDCLTLWLANRLSGAELMDDQLAADRRALLEALATAAGEIVLVSNEVGLGIVPDNPLARCFRDAAGRLNQAVAGACERVTFVAAGLPLTLKPPPA